MEIHSENEGFKRIQFSLPKLGETNRNIHSPEHDLAEQISAYFNEKRRFGMWLGIIKRKGVQRVYQAFAEVKQSSARNPVALLMHKLKNK